LHIPIGNLLIKNLVNDETYRLDHHLQMRLIFGHLEEGGCNLSVTFGDYFSNDPLQERSFFVDIVRRRRRVPFASLADTHATAARIRWSTCRQFAKTKSCIVLRSIRRHSCAISGRQQSFPAESFLSKSNTVLTVWYFKSLQLGYLDNVQVTYENTLHANPFQFE